MTNIEELLQLCLIDKKRKVRIHIQLEDKDGDVIEILDTIRALSNWVVKQLADKPAGACSRQVVPLMGQAIVGALSATLQPSGTALLLLNEDIRFSLIHIMSVGYYLFRFLDKKGIKIKTIEYPITDEEIEQITKATEIDSKFARALMQGSSPKDILENLKEQGLITDEDLRALTTKNTLSN